jgi:hypothetical protein
MTSNNETATAAGTDYTIVPRGSIQLGQTVYRVEEQQYHSTGGSQVWLYGPKGAVYFLRGFALRKGQVDDGQRQVISWKSGAPLRSRGNEVRAMVVGDIIEQYVPVHPSARG